jgi:hypothetical protein
MPPEKDGLWLGFEGLISRWRVFDKGRGEFRVAGEGLVCE